MANFNQIRAHLQQRKLPYNIIDLGGDPSVNSGQAIFKVEDVVQAGVKADEIVKTLLVRSTVKPPFAKASEGWRGLEFKTEFNALAIRGRDRLDFKKVRRIFSPKTDLAKADEVQEVVGVPVGAVCPILIGIPLYFDSKVMGLKNVNLGSGDLTRGLDMKLADLLTAVGEHEIKDLV